MFVKNLANAGTRFHSQHREIPVLKTAVVKKEGN
jgi:hypothetical protein